MIDDSNFTIFLNKLNANEETLPGYDKLKESNYIMYMVSIPRVRPHKYMDLKEADALIFIIFNIINDAVITN